MKKIFSALLLMSVMILPATAFASEKNGLYVAPKFVLSSTQIKGEKVKDRTDSSVTESMGDESDSSFGGSFAVGYDFGKKYDIPLRTELEYGLSRIAQNDDMGVQTLFLNSYLDIHTKTKLTPYIGAGVGLAFINTKFDSSSKTNSNFAWNVGAGVGYDINESWTMDLGYRFVSLGSMKTATIDNLYLTSDNTYQHQVNLGLRYTF